MTLPDVGVKVTHPGAAVLAYRTTEWLLPSVHPITQHCWSLFNRTYNIHYHLISENMIQNLLGQLLALLDRFPRQKVM